jgi:hypothetical protein
MELKMLKVPAFFFPTETVLIDDDQLYAKLFLDSLDRNCKIDIIEDTNLLLGQKNEDFLFIGDRPKNIVNSIENCVEKKSDAIGRMISVVIADFHMGDISGLELFRKLKSPYIYRILISNFIDERFQSAVNDAQNAGIIDAQLRKGDSLKYELPKAIIKGQQKFFVKVGTELYRNSVPQNCLTDTTFAGHFLKLLDDFKPEYIWPEIDFSVFTLEKKSKAESKKMFITTPEEIQTLLEGVNSQSALPKTIAALKTGDFMVCHENPHSLEGEEWAFHLRPAKKIHGSDGNYLYHVIEM